jgi:hypothetical protein
MGRGWSDLMYRRPICKKPSERVNYKMHAQGYPIIVRASGAQAARTRADHYRLNLSPFAQVQSEAGLLIPRH